MYLLVHVYTICADSCIIYILIEQNETRTDCTSGDNIYLTYLVRSKEYQFNIYLSILC